jgi:fructokinase
MIERLIIVGLGEALFDIFPEAEILGGAPLNVAVHAHQLLQKRGGRGVVGSRVGQDDLGEAVRRELQNREMDAAFVQSDPDNPTGRVHVGVDQHGEPDYEIVDNVAWDWLQFDPDLEGLAKRCDAVCFGSLAQRNAQTRNTIYRFLESSRAIKLFDVNLRQDYFSRAILQRSCELASAIKLNDDELPIVMQALGLDASEDLQAAARMLMRKFDLKQVIATQGKAGTTIYASAESYQDQVPAYQRVEQADNVGAGDACAAAILAGLVLRKPLQEVVMLANHAGAYVASQSGATPTLPDTILAMV